MIDRRLSLHAKPQPSAMITAIYIINALVAVIIAYVALDPAGAKKRAEQLGLGPWIERLDAQGMRNLLAFIGKLFILAAVLLTISILTGHHSLAWYFPAGELAFFGAMAWLASAFGNKS